MKKTIFIAAILLLAVSFFAFADENSTTSAGMTPDSPFYFLKTWKEAIQTFFTFGAENKAKQFLHLADVRLAEYQKMLELGKDEIAQKTLEKYEKQLNRAIEKVEELKKKGKDVTSISQKIEGTTSKHLEVLEKNLKKVPEAGQKGIKNAIQNSIKAVEKFQERISEKAKRCVNSGGKVITSNCCNSTDDFPNICLIGACGCSPENSHKVMLCDCGVEKCFNGNRCVYYELVEPCTNQCGNGECESTTCTALGCPCSETAESCPQDCAE
ncbi:MAG: DUF5667 domain-containing protein [Candidatus Pacebacteria bacterium]|nr:DUF5667 domain-containing protein [Candidatus Paceibacterota bacterium]